MALPAGVSVLGTFEGKPGPAGTFATAEAVTVPADQPAGVETFGPETAKGVRFYVPRGLPAVGAADDDEAMAAHIAGTDTQSHAAVDQLAGPTAVLNPETAQNGAVRTVALQVMKLGDPSLQIPILYDGALNGTNAPRPDYLGPVIWQIWAGNPTPTYFDAAKKDGIEVVKVVAAAGLPGFADEFAGPAGPLYATELGRKLYEVATRTSLTGAQAARNGSGQAGFIGSTSGNATAVAPGNAANGILRMQLAGVINGGAGMVIRYLDNANYLTVTRRDSSNFRASLISVVAGTPSLLAQSPTDAGLVQSGRSMTTIFNDELIEVRVNGSTQFAFSTALFKTATKHGLYGIPNVGTSYFAESLVFEAA